MLGTDERGGSSDATKSEQHWVPIRSRVPIGPPGDANGTQTAIGTATPRAQRDNGPAPNARDTELREATSTDPTCR